MSTGKVRGKGAARLMALLLLCSLGSGALASESTPAAVSDARLFTWEFREKGALRFYEATEEELRLGRFEAAFLRYRFLKARVGGDPAYRPLMAMVDHRLRFLAGQMGLAGQDVPPLRANRSGLFPAAPRAVKDSTPAKGAKPEKVQTGPAGPESAPSPPPAPAASPPPAAAPASGPPAPDAPPPPAPEQQKAPEIEPADQKPAAEASPPSPPSSRWQRLKARLFFWRR